MTLRDKALQYYGLLEMPGDQHNPTILNFFREIGHEGIRNDETAWCSAFMNYCAKELGLPYSGELDARSWLKVGSVYVPPSDGISWADNVIAVHWRGEKGGWQGHVSVPIRISGRNIWVLGGNQGNAVKISPYPLNSAKSGILGYRQL